MKETAGAGTEYERPDPAVRTVWRVSSALSYGTLAVLGAIPYGVMILFAGAPAWPLSVGLGALLALALLSQAVIDRQWSHWFFRLSPETLEFGQGWMWRRRCSIARDRIQHIDLNSGPLDRRFGLVQVVIYAAGGSPVGMIPGLTPERAAQLRQELMRGEVV